MSDLLLASKQALDTLTHIIGMRHLSYIGQAMAESAERTLRTAIAEAETVEPVAKIGRAANITNRLRELADAVIRGPDAVASEFTMSVPARPERDADLVLSAAADEIERLRATLERQQLSYEREREIDQEEIERLLVQRRGDAHALRMIADALGVPEDARHDGGIMRAITKIADAEALGRYED